MISRAIIGLLGLALSLGCSAKDEACSVGEKIACSCKDDKGVVSQGTQICGAGQRFSTCRCGVDEPNIDPNDPRPPPPSGDAGADTAPPPEFEPEPRGPGGVVSIGAGEFTMGCDGGAEIGCRTNAHPRHQVTLVAYDIDKAEVTQGDYAKCVTSGGCTAPKAGCVYDPATRGDFPVTCVTWDQAKAYCGAAGMRLPTEAEWERAARGDAKEDRFYPWGKDPPDCDHANFFGVKGCEFSAAKVVATRGAGASPFGALDMAGNVWEWTADFYDPGFYATSPASNPTGPSSGSARVARGGSFASGTASLQVTYREGFPSDTANREMGFRCAKTK
ncbi:MAG: SUMF1/EgtB/PvdO family nonheme iron enzyme [Polyangiales bacterium]